MQVIFSNGQSIESLGVHGRSVYYQGTSRDSLTFLFPEDISIGLLKDLFTPENCSSVALVTEDSSDIHENYTIRTGMGAGLKDSVLGSPMNNEDKVAWVTMVQTTLSEREIVEQRAVLDDIIVTMLEV